MAALRPTLECVAAPIPAPAAPPKVAPVNVPQPLAPKAKSDKQKIGAVSFLKKPVVIGHLLSITEGANGIPSRKIE
jgi:hypothetical protein